MNKEDLLRKITSRKFWLALAGLITGIVGFIKQPTTDAESITSLIMALGSVIAYILAEGWIDAAREGADVYVADTDLNAVEEKPPKDNG